MNPTDPVQPGTVLLGRYRFERTLGKGGMGIVHQAQDRNLQRSVAIKMLHPQAAADNKEMQRFMREARALAKVSHPNLMQIYDVQLQDGAPFIVMEHLPGKTLHEALRERGRLSVRAAVRIVTQVAGALGAVHDTGMVHRDVKPGNIMILPTGRAVLMDFGLAKDPGSHTLTAAGLIVGTPEYMSPEQAKGETLGPTSDIYALGVILYELLAGRPPFTSKTAIGILRMHVEADPPHIDERIPAIPEWIDDVIQTCLEKDPDDRYATMAELVEALENEGNAGEDEEDESPRLAETIVDRIPVLRRRKSPTGLWMGGIAAAAVLVGILVYAMSDRGNGTPPPVPPGTGGETGNRNTPPPPRVSPLMWDTSEAEGLLGARNIFQGEPDVDTLARVYANMERTPLDRMQGESEQAFRERQAVKRLRMAWLEYRIAENPRFPGFRDRCRDALDRIREDLPGTRGAEVAERLLAGLFPPGSETR